MSQQDKLALQIMDPILLLFYLSIDWFKNTKGSSYDNPYISSQLNVIFR
jgi:hypothetical protein